MLAARRLHDADAGTWSCSRTWAQNRIERLLVIATYRDTEGPAEHPVRETLAEVDRASAVRRMALSGLSLRESANLVTAKAGTDVAEAVVETPREPR
ncbi:MAG: hypothetical protein U5Q44_10645 [Dehalococcoidia bacterium]|nr:hypothetical protein [Dehalococcoidia bacterium]